MESSEVNKNEADYPSNSEDTKLKEEPSLDLSNEGESSQDFIDIRKGAAASWVHESESVSLKSYRFYDNDHKALKDFAQKRGVTAADALKTVLASFDGALPLESSLDSLPPELHDLRKYQSQIEKLIVSVLSSSERRKIDCEIDNAKIQAELELKNSEIEAIRENILKQKGQFSFSLSEKEAEIDKMLKILQSEKEESARVRKKEMELSQALAEASKSQKDMREILDSQRMELEKFSHLKNRVAELSKSISDAESRYSSLSEKFEIERSSSEQKSELLKASHELEKRQLLMEKAESELSIRQEYSSTIEILRNELFKLKFSEA